MDVGYLIDMDGVIYHGNQLIPGADRFIAELLEREIPFLFLTNNSQRTRRDVTVKLRRLGIQVFEDHIFTCAMATARFLAAQKPNGTAYVIGEGGLLHALHHNGYSVVDHDPDYVVVGEGRAVGGAIVTHKSVGALSFTGSYGVGNAIYQQLAPRMARAQMEMGGKNPTIVLADADFKSAVENVVNAAFFSTGQKCTATSRAIVEESIYDQFVAAVAERMAKLKVGNGMEPGIDIGPAVDQGQLETDLKYIEIGKQEGARLVCGGNRLTGGAYDKGYFVEPTLFADVTENMRIAQEEVFGPVLAVMKAKDFTDAMRIANNIPFGLSASVQTTNLSRVFEFVYGCEAGLLTINLPSAGVEYQLPFGGTKDSSFGPKEQGPAAMDFYSDYKTVYLKN